MVGGNGWRSGFICLHEQWFAQIGLALDDPDYTANFAAALDYERDHAIGPDGRVKSRWATMPAMPCPAPTITLGFYEAQWGYLMDSQPDYVINVAEQFDLTGDRPGWPGTRTPANGRWISSCAGKSQQTGLVAMMTDSRTQQTGQRLD